MGWLRRLLSLFFGTTTVAPRPAVSTQSSFQLHWEVDRGLPTVAVEATLEVDADPAVNELYFWALQASFGDGSQTFGGAHTGLQWNPPIIDTVDIIIHGHTHRPATHRYAADCKRIVLGDWYTQGSVVRWDSRGPPPRRDARR